MATRAFLALIACVLLIAITAAQIQDKGQVQTRTGPPLVESHQEWKILSTGAWWVKVHPSTMARRIDFRWGTASGSLKHELGFDRKGVPPGKEIPERYLYPGNMTLLTWETLKPETVIRVQAEATPATADAAFCVFYQQQPVALVQFTGKADLLIDRNRSDERCRPLIEGKGQR